MSLSKVIEDNKEFIDAVAVETMKSYLRMKPPNSPEDSLSIARVSYRQALAMLEVKENALLPMLEKDPNIFKRLRRQKDDVRPVEDTEST